MADFWGKNMQKWELLGCLYVRAPLSRIHYTDSLGRITIKKTIIYILQIWALFFNYNNSNTKYNISNKFNTVSYNNKLNTVSSLSPSTKLSMSRSWLLHTQCLLPTPKSFTQIVYSLSPQTASQLSLFLSFLMSPFIHWWSVGLLDDLMMIRWWSDDDSSQGPVQDLDVLWRLQPLRSNPGPNGMYNPVLPKQPMRVPEIQWES